VSSIRQNWMRKKLSDGWCCKILTNHVKKAGAWKYQ